MTRPYVFKADTRLYSAAEPKGRVFLAGDTDPGAAWWDALGGPPVGGESSTQALKDLITAQERIETLEATIARNAHDLAQIGKVRDEAVAELDAAKQEAATAQAQAVELLASATALTAERDQARLEAADLRAKLAKVDGDGDGSPGGSKTEADDPDAAEKAELRAQLKELGQPTPHHKLGVEKLRALVEAATAP